MHKHPYTFYRKKIISFSKIGVADLGLRMNKVGFVRNMILQKSIKTPFSLYDIAKSSSAIAEPCKARLWQSHAGCHPELVSESISAGLFRV